MKAIRVSISVGAALVGVVLAVYMGLPLYWKLCATVQEIRERRASISTGISQLVIDARRSVGWFYDESDSGVADEGGPLRSAVAVGFGKNAPRRLLSD
ncbi:low-density receptor-like protein [Wolffia australiana]